MVLEGGEVGILDFGQVKQLDLNDRLILCELVVALARRDDDDVILRAMKVGLNIEGVSRDLQLALSYILFDTRMVSKKSGTFRLRH